jgi:hypothetical protein
VEDSRGFLDVGIGFCFSWSRVLPRPRLHFSAKQKPRFNAAQKVREGQAEHRDPTQTPTCSQLDAESRRGQSPSASSAAPDELMASEVARENCMKEVLALVLSVN